MYHIPWVTVRYWSTRVAPTFKTGQKDLHKPKCRGLLEKPKIAKLGLDMPEIYLVATLDQRCVDKLDLSEW